MKTLFTALTIVLALTSTGQATCYGSSSFYNCYDHDSGNSYNIQKFGNSTNLNGYNLNTGSTWSQNSQTFGDTTIMNGFSSDGGYWNQTITPYGSYGYDSDGNYFNLNSFWN